MPEAARDVTAGPANPAATRLAALGSCLAARIRADAVTGSIRSPLWGTLGARLVGFEAIRVAVHREADAPPEALRALIGHALLWSPVANTIHNAVYRSPAKWSDMG